MNIYTELRSFTLPVANLGVWTLLGVDVNIGSTGIAGLKAVLPFRGQPQYWE
jgi:hypothetical protein